MSTRHSPTADAHRSASDTSPHIPGSLAVPHTPDPPQGGAFDCAWCGATARALDSRGARRTHCPSCLNAPHLDDGAGGTGRCRGRTAPIAVAVLDSGERITVHRCLRCDALASHPVHPDDNRLVLLRTAVRPLADPPFPLEVLGRL
ncbi:RNHCP domain-containing protein [Streptomyces sp. C10-9-1]|uniref:RNHCP domain-containing protein n=1 Tax=Streptomyces sp. C10-9-1 TaxID=1859285 RepID=UPI003D73ECED